MTKEAKARGGLSEAVFEAEEERAKPMCDRKDRRQKSFQGSGDRQTDTDS